MLIFDEKNEVVMVNSLFDPLPSTHFWVLDLLQRDYMLKDWRITKEINTPAIEIMVEGFKFMVPANFYLLIVDPETAQLDAVQIKKLLGKDFNAFIYGNGRIKRMYGNVTATNYIPSYKSIMPTFDRNQMLCHAIGPNTWVNIGPIDVYDKWMNGMVIADITG